MDPGARARAVRGFGPARDDRPAFNCWIARVKAPLRPRRGDEIPGSRRPVLELAKRRAGPASLFFPFLRAAPRRRPSAIIPPSGEGAG